MVCQTYMLKTSGQGQTCNNDNCEDPPMPILYGESGYARYQMYLYVKEGDNPNYRRPKKVSQES